MKSYVALIKESEKDIEINPQWTLQRQIEIREIVRIALARFEPEPSDESRSPGFQLIDSILAICQDDFSDLFIPFLNKKVIPDEISKISPQDYLKK